PLLRELRPPADLHSLTNTTPNPTSPSSPPHSSRHPIVTTFTLTTTYAAHRCRNHYDHHLNRHSDPPSPQATSTLTPSPPPGSRHHATAAVATTSFVGHHHSHAPPSPRHTTFST
nr:hypothetical protein [Tanacetum cinerariifolium]